MTADVIITCYLILAGLFISFLIYATDKFLDSLEKFRSIFYRFMLDCIDIYTTIQTARMDVYERRARLPAAPRQPSKFDIELEILK